MKCLSKTKKTVNVQSVHST